jgi:hypothetical protein
MNERIEKLAEGCFEYFEPNCDGETMEFNYKKFAELIVEECLNIVGVGGEFCSRPKLVEKIKQHFGVES